MGKDEGIGSNKPIDRVHFNRICRYRRDSRLKNRIQLRIDVTSMQK